MEPWSERALESRDACLRPPPRDGGCFVIDLERVRAETPGVEHVAHLNNAGSALPPQAVLDAVVEHLRREAEIGGYEAAAEREDRWEHTYDALARLVNANRDEIAVVENATRAWDMAFYAFRFERGDRILTGRAEYASNWIALRQVADRTGATIEVVPNDEHGQLDVAALERMLDERVKLVSLVHVPTQSGLVNPAAAVGALTRAAGVPLLLDACQSVGQLHIDVEEIGCDILSATGRKFLRGPRGTGFLYVRRGLIGELEPPFLDMHAAEWLPDGSYRIRDDARRFENWETYYAGKIGLGVAADYALALGLDAIRTRIDELAHSLRNRLAELDGVTVQDRGETLAALVTFTLEGRAATDVQRELAAQSINVSVSPGSSSQLDLGARGLDEVVRASVHYYNSEQELDRLVAAVQAAA
jgi:cysteine desulfurase / selenocysteine lyase